MEKINIEICCGTACYLLGAVKLMELEKRIPDDLKGKIEFEAKTCLGQCENDQLGGAPFVRFNHTEVMSRATPDRVIDRCRELVAGQE